MLQNITKKLGLLDADGLEKKIDQVEEQEKKNADKLVQAITDLTKHLKTVEKSSRDQKGKDRPTISGLLSDTKTTIKSFSTIGGILGHAADATAHKPIMGAILGSLANKMQSKEAEKEKEQSFVAAIATGSTYGRDLMAQAGNNKDAKREVAKKIAAQYKEKQYKENELEALNAKRSAIQSIGKKQGVELDLDQTDLKKIEELETALKTQLHLFKTGRASLPDALTESENGQDKSDTQQSDDQINGISLEEWKNAIIDAIRDGMSKEADSLQSDDKQALTKAISDNPEMISGIMEGVSSEIRQLNKSQLEELIKISTTLEQKHESDKSILNRKDELDKEAELEGKLKSSVSGDNVLPPTEKKKGLLATLLEGFGKVKDLFVGGIGKLFKTVAGIFRPLIGLISGLVPVLGPILGITAAGAAGAAVGTGVNKLVESTTGDSVGGHVYSATQSVKGFLGFKTDEDKIAEAEKQALEKLVADRRKSGEPISIQSVEKAKSLGIDVTGLNAIQSQSKQSELSKQSDKTSDRLEKTADYKVPSSDQIETLTESQKSAPRTTVHAPTVVNAQRTMNQNTTNINRINVRNPEPTYTKTDAVRFCF